MTTCPVCGDTAGLCRFETACSCWRGEPCEHPAIDPAPEVKWRDRRPAACYAGTCTHRQHDGIANPRVTIVPDSTDPTTGLQPAPVEANAHWSYRHSRPVKPATATPYRSDPARDLAAERADGEAER